MKKEIKKLLKFSLYSLYENHRDNKKKKHRDSRQKSIITEYLKYNEVKKLHIGCGSNIYEGWLNTDLNFSSQIVFLDAGNKFPFDNNVFNCIYSEHLFEHLNVSQQLNMFKEAYRVLNKGGVMRIATPSMDFLFKLYKDSHSEESKAYSEWAVNHSPYLSVVKNKIEDKAYYHCYVINNFFKAWGHQMIHNLSSLKALAHQCGFTEVRSCRVGESEVSYLNNIEKHGTIIPPEMNLLETMVIEAIK